VPQTMEADRLKTRCQASATPGAGETIRPYEITFDRSEHWRCRFNVAEPQSQAEFQLLDLMRSQDADCLLGQSDIAPATCMFCLR